MKTSTEALTLAALAATLTVALGCREEPTEPSTEALTADQVAFLDQAVNLGTNRALFCPTIADCEPFDIYGARLFSFLAADMPGEDGFRFISVADELDPGIVSEASFELRSGVTLHRMTITDEVMQADDFGFEYWKTDNSAAEVWQADDTSILEDMSRMPGSGAGFVNMWLRGGKRKRDVMAYIDCVEELTAQARAANAKKTAEGEDPGCGVFILEVWNEDTAKWDLHASMLCPE